MSFLSNLLNAFKSNPVAETPITITGSELSDKNVIKDPSEKYATAIGWSRYQNPLKKLKNINFYRSEYDLDTIANAIQIDGLLRRSVNIFVEQILKNDFELTSKNQKLQKHTKLRIKEIEALTGVSFYETMSIISRQLVSYGNAYIIKVRSNTHSKLGSPYMINNQQYNPIVGLFIADATTITLGIGTSNQIEYFRQTIRGQIKDWKTKDVIHITYNKLPGTLTGISNIDAILDDLRALRKLEEEMEILGFQFSVPLYLYKVGNKDQPAAPGEVEKVSNKINNMPAYGMMCVPGHHTIETPTSSSDSPVNIIEFVEHFKQRVYAGLGVSPVALGEVSSSNRNTSEIADLTMQTITNSYQKIIKHKLELELLREFKLDGGFKSIEEEVEFNFPEIDLESQIKKENHLMGLYQGNLVSLSEARLGADYEADFDEQDFYLHNVQIPLARETANAKADASIRQTAAKNKPTNQHGSATRPKTKKDYIEHTIDINNKLINELLDFDNKSQINFDTYLKQIQSITKNNLVDEINYTIKEQGEYYNINMDSFNITNNNITTNYLLTFEEILKDKVTRLYNNLDYSNLFHDNINHFIALQKDKIKELSKIIIYSSLDLKTILINSDECEIHSTRKINITDINYTNIPPFKYGCKCKIQDVLSE